MLKKIANNLELTGIISFCVISLHNNNEQSYHKRRGSIGGRKK